MSRGATSAKRYFAQRFRKSLSFLITRRLAGVPPPRRGGGGPCEAWWRGHASAPAPSRSLRSPPPPDRGGGTAPRLPGTRIFVQSLLEETRMRNPAYEPLDEGVDRLSGYGPEL